MYYGYVEYNRLASRRCQLQRCSAVQYNYIRFKYLTIQHIGRLSQEVYNVLFTKHIQSLL